MLIEIFSNTVYEETPCDGSRGLASKHVPKIIISERGDSNLRDMYIKARDFLTAALDNPYYSIKTGGSYMLEIEVKKCDDTTSISTSASRSKIPEKDFSFKFNSLRDTLDGNRNITIHGYITIDSQLNVISFTRDRIYEVKSIDSNTVLTQQQITDSTSTTGKRYVYDEISVEMTGGNLDPFVERCQQEKSNVKSEDDAGSDTTNEDSESPVNLSENSFSVHKGSIRVSQPDLEIGTVEGSSFSVDTEKQRRQDEFLKNMSRKISKRNKDLRNPK